ncbi:MAG: lytic transglycosylase domain-containing protein [Rhodanobacter sp.]
MFDQASYRGSVIPFGTNFPTQLILHRVALVCALILGLCCSPSYASTLYRCVGVSGETVFSSSTTGYHGCVKVNTYSESAPRRRVQAPPPVTSVSQVVGSVTTTARNLAADGPVPTSLAAVRGAVESGAHIQGDALVQRVSFAAARGSVQTNASPPAVAPAGPAGRWSYNESRTADVAAAGAASTPENKVLKGAVYRIVRADGSVEYTNLRSASSKGHAVTMLFSYIATCVACNLHSPIHWGSVALNLTAYGDSIHAASLEYGVDEAFLRAIIHAESAFNPRAMSIKGAQGLMQLMPGTASDMGVLDAFNTDQNIRGGARYLGLMLHNFHGSEQLAAAAYNAGPGAVQKYGGVPPYAETQVYVQRVTTLRKRYGEALHRSLVARSSGNALSRM